MQQSTSLRKTVVAMVVPVTMGERILRPLPRSDAE